MITDKQNNILSEHSYWVDSSRTDTYPREEGESYYYDTKNPQIGSYKVLEVSDNQSNGMQAMAIAPIVDGKVDYSNITIAYAGTNFGDPNDRRTDIENVIWGMKGLTKDISRTEKIDSQVDTAMAFAAEIQKKYPQANISTTGHSLGGYLATIVAIKMKWQATAFNAPNPQNMLTKKEQEWAKANTDIIINFRNNMDNIGNFGGDPLGIARYVDTYKPQNSKLFYYHNLSTWDFDDNGNLVDKYGLIVDKKNYKTSIDINEDGVIDISLNSSNIEPKNLFLSGGNIGLSDSKTIKVNPDSLRALFANLNLLALTELPAMIRVCQLCLEKNAKIQNDFETRKQKVEETIVQRFKETRLTDAFYEIYDSIGNIIRKKHIFDYLSSPKTLVDTIPEPAYFESGAYLELSSYNRTLTNLAEKSRNLVQHSSQEKSISFQDGTLINPTPTALKTSVVLENTAKRLKNKSEKIFEGRGLREGKKDGISESLNDVLEVEQKNLSELTLAVENVARLTLSLANNFKQMDDWLGSQIATGGQLEGMTVQNIPTSYQAYLDESGVFDDVKDVLQAFDEQVEKNSNTYAREVASEFSNAFQQVQSSLDNWSTQMNDFNKAVNSIEESFDTKIYIDETRKINKKFVTSRTYWGPLVRLYDATTTSNIRAAKSELQPLSNKIMVALQVAQTAKNDLQHLKPQLKTIIEEGVYTAFELDEIVASQKAIQTMTSRIMQELKYVIDTISSQMSGQAISTLTLQLNNVYHLTEYFNQMVGDCFGDQTTAQAVLSTGVLSSQANQFSLNN
ncbi:SA1320 family protein [Streptococcus sp. CSL10205-OR2]|uniref:SA1320 family protein n=1 Tax=Streptococcus sp. CSL10205-OR2 TaxID=2980558 RepID=UPI0021D946CC|nr:hypothetical protein [Streptococcus sp. CSL10205-OR2]MCU9533690.1 hypothetical protein [Streptococcus sp. CSL10205-OR2]